MEKLFEQLVKCNVETDTLAVTLEVYKEGLINKEDLKTFTAIHPKVSLVGRRIALVEHAHASLERKLHDFAKKFHSEHQVKAIAIQALREGLIKDEDVLSHLDSLHSEVPYSMRLRYLVQLVHQSKLKRALAVVPYQLTDTELDPVEFARNANKDGLIEKCVLDYLVSLYSHDFKPIINGDEKLHKLFIDSVEKEEENLIKLIGVKVLSLSNPFDIVSKTNDMLIAPEKLSTLYEVLVKYAFKWDKIGIALHFQFGDLKNIQASVFHEPERCLQVLLEKWLNKEFHYTLFPSMNNLKKTLNSQAVGLGSLSEELDISLFKSILQPASNPPFSYIDAELFLQKSIAIHVKEKLSTLIEIRATQWEAYRWQKDGVNLPEKSGTGPILCLHKADIDWDGCELSCQLKPEAKTPIIVPKISCELDEFRNDLASLYLAQPEVPEDSWPPVSNLKYTNLALVKQGKVDYNSEYARCTIRGDLDDVLQDKKIIAYNSVKFYNDLKSGNLVLIEGRPGSGKTTFVHKLSQDWAVKSGGSVRLLLLVSLRVLNTFSNPDLSDILGLFEGLQVSKDTIERRLGKGVCFIFDGYDEFSPQNGQSSVVNQIINKKYLRHSIVIVASRPAAIVKLRSNAKTVIEVVGFLNKQIFEYIDHYPFKTSTKSTELKMYLKLHPNTFHMCYLPIHATMVAFLFEVLGKVPRTETEIYTHFTRLTLIRSLTKSKEFEPVNINLNSLSGDEKICFGQVCLLAFDKMLSNKQVLEQNEVDFHFQVKRNIDSTLGLITVDRTAGLYGYKNIYTFLHLTFQEYLAAYHITTLSDEEQMKLIQEYGDKNHMLVVWKFYCGLIQTKTLEKKFTLLLCKYKDTLFNIQCAYETQQQIACELLLKSVNYHIKLEDEYLSTPDFTALGYVTNTTEILSAKLSLLNCNVNVEAIDALLSEMQDRAQDSIQELHILYADHINNSQMECLKKLLGNLKSLKTLSLEAKYPQLSNTEESNITLPDLSELSLTNVDITPLLNGSTLANLSSLCFKGKYMKIINLSPTSNLLLLKLSLDMKQYDLFCKCTPKWFKLQELDALFGKASVPDSKNSKLQFQFLSSANALTIKNCAHESELPKGLMAGFQRFPNVQVLDLSSNHITASSIEEICVTLCEFSCLKELHINSSQIDDHKLKALSLMLRHSPRLQKLSLSSNAISCEGCHDLAANLHHCHYLEKLDLRNNSISNTGASSIISSLKSCSHFQELFLLQNPCDYIERDTEITFSTYISCNELRQHMHKELKEHVNNEYSVEKLEKLWDQLTRQIDYERQKCDQLKDELRRRDGLMEMLIRRRKVLQNMKRNESRNV